MHKIHVAWVHKQSYRWHVTTGQKLKEWLTGKGMTQIAFAECMRQKEPGVKVDQADISKWINGRRAPNEAQKIVVQAITGIPATEWLPDNLRKLAETTPGSEDCDE